MCAVQCSAVRALRAAAAALAAPALAAGAANALQLLRAGALPAPVAAGDALAKVYTPFEVL